MPLYPLLLKASHLSGHRAGTPEPLPIGDRAFVSLSWGAGEREDVRGTENWRVSVTVK